MSNKRKLKPPPSGFSYAAFAKTVLESDLPDETKEQLLLRAAYADKKGNIPDERYPPLRRVQ
jgi:hypothetical protein